MSVAREQQLQFGLRDVGVVVTWCCLALAASVRFGFVGLFVTACGFTFFAGWWWSVARLHTVAVIMAVCGLLIGLLLPAFSNSTKRGPRPICNGNLKQIGISLYMYHEDYGRFPPAYIADQNGRPMHSWRVLLLPYMEQKALYDQYRFDEPWDGPYNRKLADAIVKVYSCPQDTNPSQTETSYVAVVGRETAWPGEKSTNAKAITDGMSNTILVVEVHHSGIHWMEPRDLSMTQMPMAINPERGTGMCSLHPNGAQAVFCDGSVHFLTDEIPPETLRALLTANAGDDASGEW